MQAFFFDCLRLDGADLADRPARERFAALAQRGAGGAADSATHHQLRRRGAGVLRRRARRRPRRSDGEVARRAVRSRQSRRELAQDQARAHARSRRARGGMGPRPAHRQALEPAPRRARSGDRRVRDARQDLQGTDRRDARMADEGAAGARDPPRRLDGVRAARAGRRDRLQRSAGEPALSRRPRAATRARQALSRRQARREADTMETVRKIFAAQT